MYCISDHDHSALHSNVLSLHQASDGKGDVYLVMCEMMNKSSGIILGERAVREELYYILRSPPAAEIQKFCTSFK